MYVRLYIRIITRIICGVYICVCIYKCRNVLFLQVRESWFPPISLKATFSSVCFLPYMERRKGVYHFLINQMPGSEQQLRPPSFSFAPIPHYSFFSTVSLRHLLPHPTPHPLLQTEENKTGKSTVWLHCKSKQQAQFSSERNSSFKTKSKEGGGEGETTAETQRWSNFPPAAHSHIWNRG